MTEKTSMDRPVKPVLSKTQKRKTKSKASKSEPSPKIKKVIKTEVEEDSENVTPPTKKVKNKKSKAKKSEPSPKIIKEAEIEDNKDTENVKPHTTKVENKKVAKGEQQPEAAKVTQISEKDLAERYPILKDMELVKKFQAVSMTNNQKGRIRQHLKDHLKGTADSALPDVINGKIQAIMKNSENLTEPELRKIRLLYNMLRVAAQSELSGKNKKKKKNKKSKDKSKVKSDNDTAEKAEKKNDEEEEAEQNSDGEEKVKDVKSDKVQKDNKKGPKRYVVFVGNLPVDIDKEQIMQHFSDIGEQIKDVRLPKQAEGKKSSIAYIELKNESSYEMALSKHHSMLNNKRINVLYTTQKNSKISKTEAKSKSAKLVALQKSGQLVGSVPLNRKRSQRRKKAKQFQAQREAEA